MVSDLTPMDHQAIYEDYQLWLDVAFNEVPQPVENYIASLRARLAEVEGQRDAYKRDIEEEIMPQFEHIEAQLAQAVEVLESAREHIAYSAPEWHYRTRDMVASIDATLAKIGGDT